MWALSAQAELLAAAVEVLLLLPLLEEEAYVE
jgi:hypothetical protein